MTQVRWYFREFKPGDNASDPDFARALFSSRDENTTIKPLVREAIQNSLDARSANASQVDVRFAIRTGSQAVRLSAADVFFDGLFPHITSSNSGVEDPPDRRSPVSYLVVEDFGTRGLIGDPETWDPFDAEKNSFFLFFRALGRSGKEGEDRGRWGVGKFVFPMTSRGHSLLALTVRDTDRRTLVMGRAVLKTHRAGTTSYHPDGHWGMRLDSSLVLPVTDQSMVNELRRIFDLRRSDEPGLSVIVPWIQEDVTGDEFLTAVAGEYFLPILRGELRVEVDHNGTRDLVDAARLVAIADSIEEPLVRARVALGLEAATWPSADLIRVKRSASSDFDWNPERLTKEQRSLANVKLEQGQVLGFRVPTKVRPKERADTDTHFDVFLQHVPGLGRVRPLIVREGITVAEDKTSYLQDYVALVVVDHSPLATFVGDAETPAHNELQYDIVKMKYTLAGKLISFLRSAAADIIRELEGADRTADHSLLAEFFPRPEPAPLPRKPKPKPAPGGDEVEEVPEIPTRPARFRIGKIDSGFTVTGTGAMRPGASLTVEFAYEIRRGNPLRRYREMDFTLERDLSLETQGVTVQSASANRILADVEDPSFTMSLTGFDKNRNVFVRVTVDEPRTGA